MRTLFIAAFLGLGSPVPAAEIQFDSLPQAVQNAFHKAHPGARIVKVAQEEAEYGEPLYEIEFKADERNCAALYHTDGSLFGYERKFPAGLLPQAVRDTLKTLFPTAEIETAEVVVSDQDEPLAYAVKISTNGETWETYFHADGSFINQLKD